jgi:Metal binding domain of Ada
MRFRLRKSQQISPIRVDKDDSADGQFWYSVKTTGVYCRPSKYLGHFPEGLVSFISSSMPLIALRLGIGLPSGVVTSEGLLLIRRKVHQLTTDPIGLILDALKVIFRILGRIEAPLQSFHVIPGGVPVVGWQRTLARADPYPPERYKETNLGCPRSG